MEVRWSTLAYDDLEHIFRRICDDDLAAAKAVVTILHEGCSALEQLPQRGRVGRMKGWRELVFPSLPYIAVYRVTSNAVEIARIYHVAQNRP